MALAERTADLQRLQAEFLNYKRRVDRDRDLIRENATYAALAPIIEVLDTIDRARLHGELEGGFKAVAEQLERVVANLGLTRFGEPGDPFDPNIHEALSHIGEDPEVKVTTCQHIAKAGYRIGDRVVRAAQVLVVDPLEQRRQLVSTSSTSEKQARPARRGGAHMTNADWAKKDFYKELGVSKDASPAEIKKAYRKLAHANHPDTHPGDDAKHEKFKSVAEAYDVVGDAEKRKQYDEIRSMPVGFGGGASGAAAASTSTTCSATGRARGGFGDMFGDLFGGGRARTQQQRRPAEGRRRRDHDDHRVHRRDRGRDGQPPAHQRRALPRLLRHRRQARHQAAHLPGVRGRRLRGGQRGGRVHDERDLPGLRWPPARLRRAVPDLPRQRPRHVRARHPGPDPGRREGRPEDPPARQGRVRRERRARPVTSTSPSR